MNSPIFTIGHSNHETEEFLRILCHYSVVNLVDVRSYPNSNRFPQFSSEALRSSLQNQNIIYHWAGKHLGGMRKPATHSRHIAIKDEGMRGYADHMETSSFTKAAVQLIHLSQLNPTVIMCAERIPQHCHRNLLADYLSLQELEVVHILDVDEVQEHQLSPAVRRELDDLVYDRNVTATLI